MMLTGMAVLLGSCLALAHPAKSAPGLSVTTAAADVAASLAATPNVPADSFAGTIVKLDGQYVLQAGSTAYLLDNQGEAAKFEGKQVKVTGMLDPNTNTIRVQSIEEA
jgi:streptogramin lyase